RLGFHRLHVPWRIDRIRLDQQDVHGPRRSAYSRLHYRALRLTMSQTTEQSGGSHIMEQHTIKAFDTDLQDIARMVAEMGGMAERQIAESVQALAKRDSKLAQRVVSLDPAIDA